MDFSLDETAEELRTLAVRVLDQEASAGRVAEHEAGGTPYDVDAWAAMAKSGLLAALLPSEVGGDGLGAVELAVLLREVGARVAPVPAYATLALGAAPIAAHGTDAQRASLAGIADGSTILTAATREPGGLDPGDPRTTARRDGDAYVLDGVKTAVPYAAVARHVLVPARLDGAEAAVFLVDPHAPGVTLDAHPTGTAVPAHRMALNGVRVAPDAALGDGAATTLRRFALAGAAALGSGVLTGALLLTTEHVKTREQFGRKLAQFQAVTMRVGDVYIAHRALDAAMWGAAWRLATGDPDADDLLAAAAYCVTEDLVSALYACQHLHGGLGVDVTYPLHRYFAWGKHLSHLLGGPEASLDALGALAIARS